MGDFNSSRSRASRATDSRNSQRGRILRLLIEARGSWASLTEILALGIAQYNSRLYELRKLGLSIENRIWREHGRKHSAFRLLVSQKVSPPPPAQPASPLTLQQEPLFDFSPEPRYPE